MASTYLTPSIIAQEALMQLQNNLVFAHLVNKDYSGEFAGKVGDTITVRRPNTFTPKEFTGEIELQEVNETGIPVKLDKLLDISIPVTSKDMTLSISNFSEQFIIPAMQGYAQDIDARLANLALDVPFVVGTAGTTPSSVADITEVRKVMNDNKVPMADRRLVVDPTAEAKLLQIETFNRADASGTTQALREAELGRKFGFDCYMNQNIVSVESVTATAPAVTANTAAGATTLAINATTLTGDIKRGTIFTIAGDSQSYVVVEDATAASNAATLKIYPALKQDAQAAAAITFTDGHVKNIAFHRNAFSLVSRTLAAPRGNESTAIISDQGIGLRVVYGYDIIHKTEIVSIDGLFGFTTLQPELACVLMG